MTGSVYGTVCASVTGVLVVVLHVVALLRPRGGPASAAWVLVSPPPLQLELELQLEVTVQLELEVEAPSQCGPDWQWSDLDAGSAPLKSPFQTDTT